MFEFELNYEQQWAASLQPWDVDFSVPADDFAKVDTVFSNGEADLGEIIVTASRGGFSGPGAGGGSGGGLPDSGDASIDDRGPDPVDFSLLHEEIREAFCEFADLVEGLDGLLLYGADGDGVDEAINLLTAASIALGLGGLLAGGLRAAANVGPILNFIGNNFGDDLALRLAPTLQSFQRLSTAGFQFGTGSSALLTALTDGDPPPNCGG